MLKKILILSLALYFSSCSNKTSLVQNKSKGSSMLLEKIITEIKQKSSKINYKLPPHEVVTLDNQLQVIFMKDDLPYIHFNLRLNAGKRFDSIAGTSEAVAGLLDKGTTSLSREAILNNLDKLGASFLANADQEFSWVQSSGLAKNGIELMRLYWNLLSDSIFLDSEWQKEKKIFLAELERLPNVPNNFLQTVFEDFSYKGAVYKSESRQSIKSLTSTHLKEFYHKHYQPASASLLVLGQYSEELKQAVIKKFSTWKTKGVPRSVLTENQNTFSSPVTLVNKGDSTQANVIIGMPVNLFSGHPDSLAVRLANFSLGAGGFNSRLMDRVRKKEGLTYGIYSYFSFLKELGTFQIVSSTNQGSLGKLLNVTFEEITNFYNNGVSQAELDFAKLYYSNSLFSSLEKKENLMESYLSLSGIGKNPVEHFETFANRVRSVSLAEVNKVIKKYFNPNSMKIFVLANKDSKGGEANPKNKSEFTITEQINSFSKNFPSHKGMKIIDYKGISY
ncbi:MAG: insulinase family protein [Bdellovibrionaceae bacterium]|nr:insulinase family protein [Pseudobdellovibrionaceae bacterium]